MNGAEFLAAIPGGLGEWIENSEELAEYLDKYYGEEHRRYHTLDHLLEMVREWENLVQEGQDAGDGPTWLAALLWHDLIYSPGEKDNEEKSARMAGRDVYKFVPEANILEVVKLIRLTGLHGTELAYLDETEKLFLDMDMAILGSDNKDYKTYTEQVAAEFVPVVGEEKYLNGRLVFLDGLILKNIFLTDFYKVRLEEKARANIRAERDWLVGRMHGQVGA